MIDGNLTVKEFSEKYPQITFYHEQIAKYCISIYKKNGYKFSCDGCIFCGEKDCSSLELTLDELKDRYERLTDISKE